MDVSLLGETITAAAANQTHYGFWMMAAGNDGVASCEAFLVGNQPFTVHLETKSSNAADSSAVSIGSVSVTAIGVFKFDVNNALDLVRYRATSSGPGSVHIQFAQPLWQPN